MVGEKKALAFHHCPSANNSPLQESRGSLSLPGLFLGYSFLNDQDKRLGLLNILSNVFFSSWVGGIILH